MQKTKRDRGVLPLGSSGIFLCLIIRSDFNIEKVFPAGVGMTLRRHLEEQNDEGSMRSFACAQDDKAGDLPRPA